LFRPFNTPQAQSYLRLLTDLYTESCRASQPLRRDLVLDLIIRHNPPSDDPLTPARETLNFLQDSGWLRTEVQPDFKPACTLTPFAFQLLQTLNAAPLSVLDLVTTISDLLKAALLDIENESRLESAVRLTDQLLVQLKSLQHNPQPGLLPDTARQRAAVLEAAAKLETRGHLPALYIREQFELLDRLLDDVATRQMQSRPAPVQVNEALAKQLSSVIKNLAGLDKKAFSKQADSLINLYGTSALPLKPNEQPAPNTFVPDDSVWPQPTQSEVAAARADIARQFNRPISPSRVQRLAQSFLQGKPYVRAADLVLSGQADLALLIQFRLQAEAALGYVLEDQPWVELNGLVFRDFLLKDPSYVAPMSLPETPNAANEPVEAGENISD
jgi:hypothetical protein